ncbi:hypothetical protein LY622_21265 [Halomonas sp. M5N1S17]|nr:hypothetical protein [Halomonas alkalisoli]MCE9665964.1 hypothetical protein [Halomonas alkalisoli]MCE9680866.1 hypothetical protein [Halomonas alkalisoli]
MAQLRKLDRACNPHQFTQRGGTMPGNSPKHRRKAEQQQRGNTNER